MAWTHVAHLAIHQQLHFIKLTCTSFKRNPKKFKYNNQNDMSHEDYHQVLEQKPTNQVGL